MDVHGGAPAQFNRQQFRTPAATQIAVLTRRGVHQLLKCSEHLVVRLPFTASALERPQPLFAIFLVQRPPALNRRACRIQSTRHFRHAIARLPQQQNRVSSSTVLARLLSQSLQSTPHRPRNPRYTVSHRAASSVTRSSLPPRSDRRTPPELPQVIDISAQLLRVPCVSRCWRGRTRVEPPSG